MVVGKKMGEEQSVEGALELITLLFSLDKRFTTKSNSYRNYS